MHRVPLLSQVTERHETVMAQLMSGDPKNQNIPGLDAILRGEVLRKDALIAQLMNQGNNKSGFLPTLFLQSVLDRIFTQAIYQFSP